MTKALDRRLHAFRPDLADAALEGRVEAARFTVGEPAAIRVPVTDLRASADASAGIDTQALFGEPVTVFDRAGGWAWIKLDADGYVGYVPEADLGLPTAVTHYVAVPRTFFYSGPDLRFSRPVALSAGSRVAVIGKAETRGTTYALAAGGGALIKAHLKPLGERAAVDPASFAALFLETPYLWGGRSGFGIDCSGLVQIAHALCGVACPRDSDMQAAGFGAPFDPRETAAKRGDLVFWKGHVGILEDPETLLHASGGTMTVTREPLDKAIARIAALYGNPTGWRRPPAI